MIPTILPEHPVREDVKKLSQVDIARLLAEDGGASALLVLLRDDKVDTNVVIDALTKYQSRPSRKMKRGLMAFVEAILR